MSSLCLCKLLQTRNKHMFNNIVHILDLRFDTCVNITENLKSKLHDRTRIDKSDIALLGCFQHLDLKKNSHIYNVIV